MALNVDKEQKKNNLENITLSELVERFCNELITYRDNLVTGVENAKEINKRATKEYEERIKPIKEELVRREQLYLMYHHSYFGG